MGKYAELSRRYCFVCCVFSCLWGLGEGSVLFVFVQVGRCDAQAVEVHLIFIEENQLFFLSPHVSVDYYSPLFRYPAAV